MESNLILLKTHRPGIRMHCDQKAGMVDHTLRGAIIALLAMSCFGIDFRKMADGWVAARELGAEQ